MENKLLKGLDENECKKCMQEDLATAWYSDKTWSDIWKENLMYCKKYYLPIDINDPPPDDCDYLSEHPASQQMLCKDVCKKCVASHFAGCTQKRATWEGFKIHTADKSTSVIYPVRIGSLDRMWDNNCVMCISHRLDGMYSEDPSLGFSRISYFQDYESKILMFFGIRDIRREPPEFCPFHMEHAIYIEDERKKEKTEMPPEPHDEKLFDDEMLDEGAIVDDIPNQKLLDAMPFFYDERAKSWYMGDLKYALKKRHGGEQPFPLDIRQDPPATCPIKNPAAKCPF